MTATFRALAIAATLSVALILSVTAAPGAAAQTVAEGGDPATAPCIEGAPERGTTPPGTTSDGSPPSTVSGPSPVGRCEPTTGQRIVDSLNLLWILALLGFGVFVAVRWAVGGGRDHAAGPDQPAGGPVTRH